MDSYMPNLCQCISVFDYKYTYKQKGIVKEGQIIIN